MTLSGVAALGPQVAPLPTRLLGAERPLRAFVGHVEPTFDWTLRNPANQQPLTDGIVQALYPRLYQLTPRTPVGRALWDWFGRVGALYASWDAARNGYNSGASDVRALLYPQLGARDVESTVILGDPAAMLPLT